MKAFQVIFEDFDRLNERFSLGRGNGNRQCDRKLTNYELIATQQLLSIDSAALYIS